MIKTTFFVAAALLLFMTLAQAVPTHYLAWDYGTVPDGVTLTGFQVRRCETLACGTPCALVDLPTGFVSAAARTFDDTDVFAARSYNYDAQAVGLMGGTVVRSIGSNLVCRRVPRPGPHSVGGGKILR
jgi:hypothetical protein